MSARIVPAHHGALWLADGWRLFWARPFIWLGALIGSAAVLIVMVSIPFVGAPLFAVLTPALWAVLMVIARVVADATVIPRESVREVLREARPLTLLGAVYLVANLAATAATMLFSEGFADWMLFGKVQSTEEMKSSGFFMDAVLAMLFHIPVMLAFWFSPMLIVWQRMGAAKALFFSIAACLMCWRAFAVYGIVVFLIFLVFASVVAGVVVMGAGLAPGVARVVALPILVVYMGTLVASVYACYRDVFNPVEAPGPA
jgi:hypothetical protein